MVNIVGQESSIVCLSNRSHRVTRDGGAKATLLGSGELLVIVDLIELTAVGPPLIQAKLVLDGAHHVLLPLTKSGAVRQAEIPILDPLVRSGVQEQSSDKNLSQNKIESRFCIK